MNVQAYIALFKKVAFAGFVIKREMLRLGRQFVDLPFLWLNYFFGTIYYDLVLSRRILFCEGRMLGSQRVAIYLIYPRYGLKKSHIYALEYLASKGLATIVVSNVGLVQDDRDKLLKCCWKYIERPNYGYDFGGYRDGILSMGSDLFGLQRLVLLNDSVWFPLPGSHDWLDEVDALGVDFGGAACAYAISRPAPINFLRMRWVVDKSRRDFHYTSYAINMSGRILSDPDFMRFWKRFKLTNNKRRTVRRGEIGLSAWMKRSGYSHGSTTDIDAFQQDLRECTEESLRNILNSLLIVDNPSMKSIRQHQERWGLYGETWRDVAEKFILTVVAHQGISYAFADYVIREKGFSFLKKSPVWLDKDASDVVLRIAEYLEGEFGKVIVDEVNELRRVR